MQCRRDVHTHDIAPSDVAALNREVILVDVRSTVEFDAGHAPGAINMPIEAIEAGWRGNDARQPFVTICRSSETAQHAAHLLRTKGCDAVAIQGGMLAWAAAGLPLVTNIGTPPRVL